MVVGWLWKLAAEDRNLPLRPQIEKLCRLSSYGTTVISVFTGCKSLSFLLYFRMFSANFIFLKKQAHPVEKKSYSNFLGKSLYAALV